MCPCLIEGDDAFIRDDTELELLRTIRAVDPVDRDQAIALVRAVLETLRKPAKE
jgi:hypothetical protein